MWGALSLLMTLIPSFRDFRFLNVVALAGTGFTAIYICVSAGVHGFQHNVFLWAYGGHGVSFEVSYSLLNYADARLEAMPGRVSWVRIPSAMLSTHVAISVGVWQPLSCQFWRGCLSGAAFAEMLLPHDRALYLNA